MISRLPNFERINTGTLYASIKPHPPPPLRLCAPGERLKIPWGHYKEIHQGENFPQNSSG